MNPSGLHILSRVGAALLGGYALVWGFTVLCIVVAMAFGVSYGDAQTTAYLLAFLLLLIAVLWAFTARSVLRVWALLAGGGALLTAAAWWLAPRVA